MELIKVLLCDIDLSSGNHDRYLFRYGRGSDIVMESIGKVGLINPVILKNNPDEDDEEYSVICGYQRILACKKLGQVSCDAKIIDGLDDEGILLLVLHDNLSSNGFNEIEKGIVLKKFLNIGYSYDRLMAEITPLLKIPPNKNIIDKYLSVLRLDDQIKQSVASSELELERAFLLIALNDADREVVYRFLFRESITNTNEAKEAIRNLLDLKLIKRLEIDEFLSSGEISHIISDTKSNKRQKGDKICKLIKSMRYPSISMKEEEFNKTCRAMRLDNDVRINHSRYFEGDEVRITLKASNEETLGNNLERLLLNIRNGTFKKLFSMFK
ncbi:MAG: ParB N-terminal domain-containing protein [Candidatus Scalindua rubra]|uniref:Chromosome partitioning protein n=1 Tax=Candidatus Scalindua brodae TaxID=237368 RepID=A0A0B0EL21_9BACT|nr:MAG: chromosome partitioning protein [Candidatus Scalindua brodae]MBZ0107081.1 ParB N-terminal domain-containing protein [Candidatus Scalindua rubra]